MGCEIKLKSHLGGLIVGDGVSVRVNCNVGINHESDRLYEIERLEAIKASDDQPDTFMDLSVGRLERPFYKEVQERFDCPIGFVPSYLLPVNSSITKNGALDIIKKLGDDGVSFITLHFTASAYLYELAKEKRKIPMTSRGGAAVLRQIQRGGDENENIWLSCLPEIVDIVKAYRMAISLGATFRPAGICDACDEVHLRETEEQLKLCKSLQDEGVQVMVENVGHISMDRLEKHCGLLRQFNAPIMPLGPLPTDCAENEDHIASAIGATMMGYWNCAHIINCVTRSEHTKSFFSIEETLEAIRTARIAAHIVDVARGIDLEKETEMLDKRAQNQCCIVEEGRECHRCSMFCPLKAFETDGKKN